MKTVHSVIIALAIAMSATIVVAVQPVPVPAPAPVAPVTVQAPPPAFQISAGGQHAAFVLNTRTGAVTLCTGPSGTSPATCSGIGKAE
jgi:hypothetical protein